MNRRTRKHPPRRVLILLSALFLFGAVSDTAQGQRELAGVPYPTSEPVYHQPVSKSAAVLQGNEGMFRRNNTHLRYGWDYDLDVGSPVVAARSGVVRFVQTHSSVGGSDEKKFLREVNTIVIDHLDGTGATYSHLQKSADPVRRGEYVLQGEVIGYSGDTGFALRPHLFYTVIDMSSEESIPSRFADFRKNEGLPEEGDKAPGAPPPAVPQKVIKQYKATWRACLRAEQLGQYELAWMLASGFPRKRYREYFYDKVLAAREAELRARVSERLTTLAVVASPDSKEIREALQLEEALSKVKDPAMRDALHKLKQGMEAWSGEEVERWRKERAAIGRWCDGLRLECFRDKEKAIKSYADAVRSSRGLFRDKAKSALKRLVRGANSDIRHAFSRLIHEAEIAQVKHGVRIKAEAEKAWKTYKPFYKAWEKNFPEEKDKAETEYAELEALYKKLVKK